MIKKKSFYLGVIQMEERKTRDRGKTKRHNSNDVRSYKDEE